MSFESFLSDTLAGILTGVFLTLLIFLIKERWLPLPDLSGRWYVETQIESSAYRPFRGIKLKYEVMLLQGGTSLRGTAEKIFEDNQEEAFEFENENVFTRESKARSQSAI